MKKKKEGLDRMCMCEAGLGARNYNWWFGKTPYCLVKSITIMTLSIGTDRTGLSE